MGKVSTRTTSIDVSNAPLGVSDRPCPECGPSARAASNRVRKVLRVWNQAGFITYTCARCGVSGWWKDKDSSGTAPPPPKIEKPQKGFDETAERLWSLAVPWEGTIVETYLRKRGINGLILPSIRYLPPNGRHKPTMIAKFHGTKAVHLTRLKEDGSGKAEMDVNKLMLGNPSGHPIVINSAPTHQPTIVCEGIEDGASIAMAVGMLATVWAAGSAAHMPKLIGATGDSRPVLAFDLDRAGLRAYHKSLEVIGPSLRTLRFPKRRDANAILQGSGLEQLREFIFAHR